MLVEVIIFFKIEEYNNWVLEHMVGFPPDIKVFKHISQFEQVSLKLNVFFWWIISVLVTNWFLWVVRRNYLLSLEIQRVNEYCIKWRLNIVEIHSSFREIYSFLSTKFLPWRLEMLQTVLPSQSQRRASGWGKIHVSPILESGLGSPHLHGRVSINFSSVDAWPW